MKSKTFYKNCLLIFLLLTSAHVYAQKPRYLLKFANEKQTAPDTIEFDVFIQSEGESFELAILNFSVGIDTSIRNGGTLSAIIIPGSSGFTKAQAPVTLKMASVNRKSIATECGSCEGTGIIYNYLNVSAQSIPTLGTGTVIIPVKGKNCLQPGIRVARFRITNTRHFREGTKMNLVWSASPGTQKANTVVDAFVGSRVTPITDISSNLNWNSKGSCAINPVIK